MISIYKTTGGVNDVIFSQSPFYSVTDGILRYSLTDGDGEIYNEAHNGGIGADVNNYVTV